MERIAHGRHDLATLAGLALIAVGSWLPWIRTDPTGPVPAVYIGGMDSGLETWGALLLPLAVLAALVVLARPDWRARFLLAAGVGGFGVAIAFYQLLSYPPLTGAFRAGVGVYVVAVGSVLALAAGHYGYHGGE